MCRPACAPSGTYHPLQTHGTDSLIIDDTYLNATHSERQAMLQGIDALITRMPGCCICISTADCIPVLLYDRQRRIVAAVHAGWRGTVNRILAKTLHRMQSAYGTRGTDVIACIGPGISLDSFEVGDEVYERFAPKISRWNTYPYGSPKRTNTI